MNKEVTMTQGKDGILGFSNETTMILSGNRSPVMKTRHAFSLENHFVMFMRYARVPKSGFIGGWHENSHDSRCDTTIQNENAQGIFILKRIRGFHQGACDPLGSMGFHLEGV